MPSRILFVALVNDVGGERLPAAMGALGAMCATLSPPGFYCAETRHVRRRFTLPRHRKMWLALPFLRSRLEQAVRDWDAEIVIPLDEISAGLLRGLVQDRSVTARLLALLETSLGAPSGYDAACTRAGLMQLAAAQGVHVPAFRVTDDADDMVAAAVAWGYPAVLKTDNSCGGHGVTIAHSAADLHGAVARLQDRSMRRRVRLASRSMIWRTALRPKATHSLPVLQAFTMGKPAMRTVSAWQGRVLEGVSFVAERTHPGPTGPSTMVRHIENAEMQSAVEKLVAALGCSGFVSFDFILDEATGRASLIEMNPRPIATTSLGALFGHDPCAALLDHLSGQTAARVEADPAMPRCVALFPKEIERDPTRLDRLWAPTIHHDVPHDDPPVIAAYLRRLSLIHPGSIRAIARALSVALPSDGVASQRPEREPKRTTMAAQAR
ncbi:ATP-grasp domain-containing protein [Acidisphaera sp. L21]|uniref:ATP-binding protein n=1 Tax=Acidisphaera sp. L21 TaxID=1641851 RepID=UPI00131BBB80|nr:ATP-grasp domain-containing protein [Acidisphaera sp. L21]